MADQEGRRPRPTRPRKPAEIVHVAPSGSGEIADRGPEATPATSALAFIERARDVLTVRRVFGEPIQQGGVTVIPAAHVRGGGGGGGGQGPNGEGGSGGGFGVAASPAGVYVVKNGTVRWEPAFDLNRTVLVGQIVGIVALLTLRSVVKALTRRR
jgi:uncharacterized spore protein YtfJ